jgi:hypothetical protein
MKVLGVTRGKCQEIHLHLTYKWYGYNKGIKKKSKTLALVQHTSLDHETQIHNNLGYKPQTCEFGTWQWNANDGWFT